MSKPYKSLLGNRIYLEMPRVGNETIIVDENTKEALMVEFKKKMMKAIVYDVGTTVHDFTPGDCVLVSDQALQTAPMIPLTEELTVILISPFDVVHIW